MTNISSAMIIRSLLIGFICCLTLPKLSFAQQTQAANETASIQGTLQVLADEFKMTKLNRTRKIWVYLPPGYHDNAPQAYPVLYMQDGQTLFDAKYSNTKDEWRIDETLDALYNSGKITGVIVVGIESVEELRADEYGPYYNSGKDQGGDGPLYADFIINDLKPYVDANYRTLPGRQHTAIGGASLGGLISLYMLRQHNNVFGMGAIFSPVIWFNREDMYNLYSSTRENEKSRNFLVASKQEKGADAMIKDLNVIYNLMERSKAVGSKNLLRFAEEGQHNESFYQKEFELAFLYLFNPENITGIDDYFEDPDFRVYPNPVSNSLNVKYTSALGNLTITDITGRTVAKWFAGNSPEETVDVSGLAKGQYIIHTNNGLRKVFIKL